MTYLKSSLRLTAKADSRTLIVTLSVMLALQLMCVKLTRAQVTAGTILGAVTDPSGAAIPAASVTVLNTATGTIRKVETDSAGNYEVPNLLPGNYSITIEHNGFQTGVVNGILLQVNQTARYNVTLKLGQITQQVQVSASGMAKIQTTNGALGQVIGQQYVADLPLNGRNYMQLLTIGTGAVTLTPQSNASAPQYGDTGRTGLSYSVSGQESTSGSYLVDGIESKMNFDMVPAWLVSLDFVQEFKVQSNNMSAEFGGGPVVINVATKSGTNQIHGSAFEYVRNDAFDSAQIQDPVVNGVLQKARYEQNQFGASIGGPVILPHIYNGKDHTFWFFDYEGLRFRQFSEFQGWEPTTAMLNGDFSGLTANGTPVLIYDPSTYNPATGLRQQFPGNIIPSQDFSKLGKEFASFLTPPTIPSGNESAFNTFGGRDEINDADQYNVRIDETISDKTSIFGRVSTYNNPLITPLGLNPISAEDFPIQDTNSVVEVTHIFSPTAINELHLGYNRELFNTVPYNPSGQNVGLALGITNLDPSVYQYGAPSVGGVNFMGFGPDGFDVVSYGHLFTYDDMFTTIRGRHTIKIGADVLDQRPWVLAEDAAKRGSFSFTGEFTAQLQNGSAVGGTGSDVADMLLGWPEEAMGQTGSTMTRFTSTSPAGYVEDDFNVGRGLTLDLGFRYDYDMRYKPEDNNIEGFCQTCRQDGEPGMLVQTMLGQVRSQVVDPDFRQFAPRLGVAWSPLGAKNTVLRGGFGIFYDNIKGDDINMMEFPPSKTALDTFENTNPTPTFNLAQAFPLLPPGPDTSPYVTDIRDNNWPHELEWNFDVQHTFARNWMVDIAYVGSHGKDLDIRYNVNQAYPSPNPLQPTPLQSRRPFPLYGDLLDSSTSPSNIMNYDALQSKLEKTFSGGYSLIAGYTFSRCLNLYNADSSDVDNQNAHDLLADYGLCGYDVRHAFDFGGVWQIPSRLRGVGGALTKGWQLDSIVTLQSGNPIFGPYMPGDWANVGTRYHERMNRVCDGNSSNPTTAEWFNSSCFVPPEPGTFGNAGRGIIIGPPLHDVDMSLIRNFRVTERLGLQFRWEIFNVLNQGNYDDPGNTYGSPGYDQITTEEPKRIMQFALRLSF